jgi:N-acetylneuraminate synthase/N,N'-diacetyllegionaminate synthase
MKMSSAQLPSFNRSFCIETREVGGHAPTLIIAEAGVAHFGDMALALELVAMAAEAGADVFKTQFFDVEQLFAERASEWRDRLRPRNMTLDQARELQAACRAKGLLFMSTAHDESRIAWLAELDVPAIKVGSGEKNNPAFLAKLAQLGRPMIVSTGMYTDADVREALAACAEAGCPDVALLHCVTSYPTPPSEVNLAAMDALRTGFAGPVGYSDHTADFLAAYAAVARGAKVIEKHITILRDVPNAQDWKVSAGPENFRQFVRDVRQLESMIGTGIKQPSPCEVPAMMWALKSLVAARDLQAGQRLRSDDLIAKRPGDGILPNDIDRLLGRRLAHAVAADAPVLPQDLEAD